MTLKRALGLVSLQCLFVFVLGFMVIAPRLFPDPDHPLQPSLPLMLFLLASTTFGAGALVWWGSVRSVGRTWRDLGWHADGLARQLLFGGLGAIVTCSIVSLTVFTLGVPWDEIQKAVTHASLAERMTFVAIGVQAAFVEESLFNGNLLPLLRERFPRSAIPLSAMVFSIYHLNFNPVGLGIKTGMGLTYGTLRVTQRSLVAPAVAHALTWIIAGAL